MNNYEKVKKRAKRQKALDLLAQAIVWGAVFGSIISFGHFLATG